MANPLIERLAAKQRLREKIAGMLGDEERRNAENDHHARRPPRPCGMTVHTGIGCPLGCIYCYIYDMGFPGKATPYPLSPLQLVYALLSNPYFIPGPRGTLVAIGSVTEPFLPETRQRAIEYIEAIAGYLKNPIQFSTKARLGPGDAERLKRADPGISPLITIISLRKAHILEPNAPPPRERLETIRILGEKGLKPILFYRPIIPGVNDEEAEQVFRAAAENGATAVVLGGLRVTPGILARLRAAGLDTGEIERRLRRRPRQREQLPVYIRDIKTRLAAMASRTGLIVFPQACMANLYTHGRRCHHMPPLPGLEDPLRPEPWRIAELAEYLGIKLRGIEETPRGLLVEAQGPRDRLLLFEENIRTYYAICVRRRR